MTCHKCGSTAVEEQATDLPFNLAARKILVVKQVPAHICTSCGETLLSDDVLARIEGIVGRIQDLDCELEVVRYAAKMFSDRRVILESRVGVPAETVSKQALKRLDRAAVNFKKGKVSEPIDLDSR